MKANNLCSIRGAGVAAHVAAMAALLCSAAAQATPINFTLVQSLSSLDLNASLSIFGGALSITEQAGTRATSYLSPAPGSIVTALTPGLIKFPGGSIAAADFQRTGILAAQLLPGPGGDLGNPDPGNYGITGTAPLSISIPPITIPGIGTINLGTLSAVQVHAAVRNLTFDVSAASSLLRTGPANSQFDASQVDLSVTGGDLDVSVSAALTMPDLLTKTATLLLLQTLAGQLPPEIPLSVSTPGIFSTVINIGAGFSTPVGGINGIANSASGGLIQHIGPNYQLTLPVDIDPLPEIPAILGTLLGLSADFNLSGQFVARAPYQAVVPEPSTWALALSGLAVVGLVTRKRRAA